MKLGQKVEVINPELVKQDEHLSSLALQIIEENKFIGEITKIEDDLYYVGFRNSLGWVTQFYEASEIKGVE